MKKTLSVLLAIILIVSVAAVHVSAAKNITWFFNEKNGTLTVKGTGAIDDYYIEVEDIVIEAPWFGVKDKVKKIVVEEGITEIGDAAFMNFFYVEEVVLPSTLETIGAGAFDGCIRLEGVAIPDSVKVLEDSAFAETALKKYVLPKSLEVIDEEINLNPFNMCIYLESIEIPKEVGAITVSVNATNPSLREVYNYSDEALVIFDNNGVADYWPGDIETAEYFCIATSLAFDIIENPELTEEETMEIFYEKLEAFYGEDYMNKIPNPPNMIETYPQYIIVYCYENSVQHKHCLEKGINFRLLTVEKEEENENNENINNPVEDKECDHFCHKSGIMGFLWKIVNFFNKLFGKNKVCNCGYDHY